MTTSDTPETDAAVIASGGDWSPVLRETCRRLERERDEARKKYDTLAVENMLEVNKLCEERDELLNEIKRLRLDAQRESEHHDRMVRELEKVYKERDEAREVVRNIVRAGRVGRKWQSYAIEFLEKLEETK